MKKYYGYIKIEINKILCFWEILIDNFKVNFIYCILLSILGYINCYIIMYIYIEEWNFVGFDRLIVSCYLVGVI